MDGVHTVPGLSIDQAVAQIKNETRIADGVLFNRDYKPYGFKPVCVKKISLRKGGDNGK